MHPALSFLGKLVLFETAHVYHQSIREKESGLLLIPKNSGRKEEEEAPLDGGGGRRHLTAQPSV
jgi:hypothetical protein